MALTPNVLYYYRNLFLTHIAPLVKEAERFFNFNNLTICHFMYERQGGRRKETVKDEFLCNMVFYKCGKIVSSVFRLT